MTPPPHSLYLAGSTRPFLSYRPELYPRLGPLLARLLDDLRRDGLAVAVDWCCACGRPASLNEAYCPACRSRIERGLP